MRNRIASQNRPQRPAARKLSDFRNGLSISSARDKSLNRSYDEKRVSIPIEYGGGKGLKRGRSEGDVDIAARDIMDVRLEDEPVHDAKKRRTNSAMSLSDDGARRLDDLLAGRVKPKRATLDYLPLRDSITRQLPLNHPDGYAAYSSQPLDRFMAYSTGPPQYLYQPDVRGHTPQVYVKRPYDPPYPIDNAFARPFVDHFQPFQPDFTSTPRSQVPPFTPSPQILPTRLSVIREMYNDGLDPNDYHGRGYEEGLADDYEDPPLRRGILKNNHIEPFYPSEARQLVSVPTNNTVRFRNTPDERFISPQWSSASDSSNTYPTANGPARYVPNVPSDGVRFHGRFEMPQPFASPHRLDRALPTGNLSMTRRTETPQSRIPTPLAQAHQPLIQPSPVLSSATSRLTSPTPSRTPAYRPKHVIHVEPGKRAHEGLDIPVLDKLEESILRSPSGSDTSSRHTYRSGQTSEADKDIAGRRVLPTDRTHEDGGEEDDATVVGTDELNLRSIDESRPDRRHYANYPPQVRQASSTTSFSHSEYLPSESQESDISSPASRPMTLTESAWRFDVPKEVEQQTRRNTRNSHRTKADGQHESQRSEPVSAAPRQELQKPIGRQVKTVPTPLPSQPDETYETISVFSDDDSQERKATQDEQEDIRMLSPVIEEEEDDDPELELEQRPTASQVRKSEMEGFFAPGTEGLGFTIWRDGY